MRVSYPRILVAGIGNIFLGDDAFGPEVAARLLRRGLPEGVRVVDFGTSGFDLVRSLIGGCDAAVLLHATPQGDAPGTLSTSEWQRLPAVAPDAADLLGATRAVDPLKALQLAMAMGARLERAVLVRCEPEPRISNHDPLIGMTDAVRAAVDDAVAVVEQIVAGLRGGQLKVGQIAPVG